MVTMLLIDIENQECKTVEVSENDGVADIRRYLACSHFEFVPRRVDGKRYGFYMDEEGRLNDKPVSALSVDRVQQSYCEDFRGNLLIFNLPTTGDVEQSLTDEDVRILKSHVIKLHNSRLIFAGFSI